MSKNCDLTDAPNFSKPIIKTTWNYRSHTFIVDIVHWLREGEEHHTWNIYAYIYKGNSLFQKLDQNKLDQDVLADMPLHGGSSFNCWHTHRHAGDVCSFQTGSDYNHLYDDHFGRYSAEDGIPCEVKQDAIKLVKWLEYHTQHTQNEKETA